MLRERAQQLFHAKVADRRTKERRRLLAGQIQHRIKSRCRTTDQIDLVIKRFCAVTQKRLRRVAVQAIDGVVLTDAAALTGLIDIDTIFEQMISAPQIASHADGPGDRRNAHAQHFLDLIDELDGRAALAVELVDESHDGCRTQAADFHQADGALFHTLGAVDDHQRRVDRRQRAIGVFGKVFVAWRVQQIDDAVIERKLHDRRGHRDAALLLQSHPVRGGVTRRFAALDRTGQLNGTAEQQQLFGQCGLACVGVRDDGKGATPRNLVSKCIH